MPDWPPRGVFVPTRILIAADRDGTPLPATIRDTWMLLKALAGGRDFLEITFEEILRKTGKARSPVLAHLATLRDRCGLRYHTAGGSLLQVWFNTGALPAAPADAQRADPGREIPKSGLSRNQDSPSLKSLNDSKDSLIQRRGNPEIGKSRNQDLTGRPAPNGEWLPDPARIFLEHGGQFPSGRLHDGRTKKAHAIDYMLKHIPIQPEALERWGRVVEAYCAQWASTSYKTMIDSYFLQDRIPGETQHASRNAQAGNRKSESPGEPSPLARQLAGRRRNS